MTDTPPRRIKQTSGYRPPHDIERELNALVESGEYASKSDVHTAALRFWFQYRRFDVKAACRKYLISDEGRELIRELMRSKKYEKKD